MSIAVPLAIIMATNVSIYGAARRGSCPPSWRSPVILIVAAIYLAAAVALVTALTHL